MQCITPEHYQDIIEERSIINICGYPICGNRTTLVSNQINYFLKWYMLL